MTQDPNYIYVSKALWTEKYDEFRKKVGVEV